MKLPWPIASYPMVKLHRKISQETKLQKLDYSGTTLLWTPLGPKYLSRLVSCPYFRGRMIHVCIKVVLGQVPWFTMVSLFQECPLRGVPLYICDALMLTVKMSPSFLWNQPTLKIAFNSHPIHCLKYLKYPATYDPLQLVVTNCSRVNQECHKQFTDQPRWWLGRP